MEKSVTTYEELSTSPRGEDHAPALQVALPGEFEQLKAQLEQSTYMTMTDQDASNELTRMSVANENSNHAHTNDANEEYQRVNMANKLSKKSLIHPRRSISDIATDLPQFQGDYETARRNIISSQTLEPPSRIECEPLRSITIEAATRRDWELFDTILLKGKAETVSKSFMKQVANAGGRSAEIKLHIKRSFEQMQNFLVNGMTNLRKIEYLWSSDDMCPISFRSYLWTNPSRFTHLESRTEDYTDWVSRTEDYTDWLSRTEDYYKDWWKRCVHRHHNCHLDMNMMRNLPDLNCLATPKHPMTNLEFAITIVKDCVPKGITYTYPDEFFTTRLTNILLKYEDTLKLDRNSFWRPRIKHYRPKKQLIKSYEDQRRAQHAAKIAAQLDAKIAAQQRDAAIAMQLFRNFFNEYQTGPTDTHNTTLSSENAPSTFLP